MDSNHDIVPTLRMMDGVYTRLAADEIERLRARVAFLERRADTSLIPGAEPTHRCKVCGAYWRKWNVDGESSWNLCSRGCGECCDNAAMGEQIEALVPNAKVGAALHPAIREGVEAAFDGRDGWQTKIAAAVRHLPAEDAKVGGDKRERFVQWYTRGTGKPISTNDRDAETAWDAWRAALSADGGEDKRDAERYRWLRDNPDGDVFVWDVRGAQYLECGRPLAGNGLDEAIDATIAANQSGKGGEQ